MKNYSVCRSVAPIVCTGKGEDLAWSKAQVLTDFQYPWRNEEPPSTTFRALWTDEYLYFLYHAKDTDIANKVLVEEDILAANRVEIFFRVNEQMTPYYSLEIDARARVLDTQGFYYRNIDFGWEWPKEHLSVKSSIHDGGYIVEGAITMESLRQLHLLQPDGCLEAGLYRANYEHNKGQVTDKWISWVNPQTETPDFHVPASFGYLKLEDY